MEPKGPHCLQTPERFIRLPSNDISDQICFYSCQIVDQGIISGCLQLLFPIPPACVIFAFWEYKKSMRSLMVFFPTSCYSDSMQVQLFQRATLQVPFNHFLVISAFLFFVLAMWF